MTALERKRMIMRAEKREFIFPSGQQAAVLVSRLAPGKFRIEEYLFGPACLVEEADIPDAAGMGWLIEADELTEGRLQVQRILEDPDVECVNGRPISPEFAKSLPFQTFSDAIFANGGRWELLFHGIFSAHVPKNQMDETPFSLERGFDEAVQEWVNRQPRNPI